MEARFIIALLVSFTLTLILLPILIKILRKEKMGQNILSYVEMHKVKAGTPTMGGIAFVLSIVCSIFLFCREFNSLSIMAAVVTISFGIIGFLDDFIKFKFKRNLGLRPYQKIISQLAISVAVAIFAYKSSAVGSVLNLPFVKAQVDIGWGIIPFVIFIFLATTNSVNLTDGLDGLASLTSISFLFTFVLVLIAQLGLRLAGSNVLISGEYANLELVCFIAIGALLAFLLFNAYPAKVFMGDTGSLALGGLIASVAIFSRNSLFIPIIGLSFVLSSVSVIIQVAYFKVTKKRVFLMAPLHHHFEKKGVSETKIVAWYGVITLLIGLLCLLFELV